MKEYYFYLWCTTWPDLVVLFLLIFFLLNRVYRQIRITWMYERDAWGFVVLLAKVGLYLGVAAIFMLMLGKQHRDWLSAPGVYAGTVEAIQVKQEQEYVLDVSAGEETQIFYIDRAAGERLRPGDQISLVYLPLKKQVVKIEVLSH